MKRPNLSQEALKLTACLCMLIDHIGATLIYGYYHQQSMALGRHVAGLWNLYLCFRIIGRIAFPIFCFLLVEGFCHSHDRKKYGLRLLISGVLSELPFDLAFSGRLVDLSSNNVMLTLLLGLLMLSAMERATGFWKVAVILPFYLLAEWLRTDYSGHGILIIAMLYLTREQPKELLLRTLLFLPLLWFGFQIRLGSIRVPLELWGMLAIPWMACYQGRKKTYRKAVQWLFYLFYPVHMLLLGICKFFLFG